MHPNVWECVWEGPNGSKQVDKLQDIHENLDKAITYFEDVVKNDICVNQNKILFLCGWKKFKSAIAITHTNTAIPAREVDGT